MIVREIKQNRDEILARFDWFNDYKDTRIYALDNCDEETVRLLDEGNDKWWRERMNKFQSNSEYRHADHEDSK